MKKSEMVLKMTRFYHIQHCMVESKYETPQQFMEKLLEMVLEAGLNPPDTTNYADAEVDLPVYDDGCKVDRLVLGWDKEEV